MRLLLFLSALLTALAGGTGARAMAQPVQASAAAAIVAPLAVTAAPVFIRFAAPAYGSVPPLRFAAPRLSGTVALPPLYAERRRE